MVSFTWRVSYRGRTSTRMRAGAGGRHEAVPTEWRYAEILSCYNAYMDADALGLGAMANASFYQHYPLAAHYPQNAKPTRDSLIARGLLDAEGRIVPRCYVAALRGGLRCGRLAVSRAATPVARSRPRLDAPVVGVQSQPVRAIPAGDGLGPRTSHRQRLVCSR